MSGGAEKVGRALRTTYFAAALIFIYLPIGALVLFAFQSSSVPAPPFDGPSLRWFGAALGDPRLTGALGNSVYVALASSALATVFGTLAAYGIERHAGAAKGVLRGLFMLPLTVSYLVTGLGLLIMLNKTGVPKSLGAVIVGHAAINMPVVIVLVSSQMQRGLRTLERAARDLGAGEWGVLRHVVIPSLAVPIAASFILCVTFSWDEFIIALLTSRFEVTLPVEIWAQLRSGLNPKMNAIGAICFAASALLLIVCERLLRSGRDMRSQA